jgi:hypothetical protein
LDEDGALAKLQETSSSVYRHGYLKDHEDKHADEAIALLATESPGERPEHAVRVIEQTAGRSNNTHFIEHFSWLEQQMRFDSPGKQWYPNNSKRQLVSGCREDAMAERRPLNGAATHGLYSVHIRAYSGWFSFQPKKLPVAISR